MKKRIMLLLAALMTLLSCAENEFEYNNPLDRTGPNYKGDKMFTFTDGRDSKKYRAVAIGTQTWMAENLNYDVPNNTTDVCYGNSTDNCAKYGRLYNWSTAMTACPAGWHLPSYAEWTALENHVGGSSTAGRKLKSIGGWYDNGNGRDEYGFSALPGGYGYSAGSFYNAGYLGYWWSATEDDAVGGWYRIMGDDYGWYNYYKGDLFSVRCVADQ